MRWINYVPATSLLPEFSWDVVNKVAHDPKIFSILQGSL